MSEPLHFDPHEWEEMKYWVGLTPGQRLGAALDSSELILSIMRAQLRRAHPDYSEREIGLLVRQVLDRRDELGLSMLPIPYVVGSGAAGGRVELRADAAETLGAAVSAALAQR